MAKAYPGLWWYPNLELYETLEIADTKHVPEDNLKKLLEGHSDWLLDTLAGFKPPSSESKAAIDTTDKIDVGGGRKVKVVSTLRKPTGDVSEYLGLDEIQSHILLRRFLDAEGVKPEDYPNVCDTAILEKVAVFYFQERQWLLRCVHVVLRNSEVMEDGGAYNKPIRDVLDQLLGKGLEDKLFKLLSDYCGQAAAAVGGAAARLLPAPAPGGGALRVPQQAPAMTLMAAQQGVAAAARAAHYDLWAKQVVQEQVLLLEALFLLYYSLAPCSAPRYLEIARAVHAGLLAPPPEHVAMLSAAAMGLAEHARHLGALLLVEALDLEGVLQRVCDEEPLGTGGEHAITGPVARDVDQLLRGWWDSASPLHALVFLAWGTFVCLAGGLPGGDLGGVQHSGHVAVAQKCGGLGVLLGMLRLPVLAVDETHSTGYKSVLKNLVAAALAAFEESSVGDGALLTDILCELFEGQRELCEQLWDEGNVFDEPIRRHLGVLRDRFPATALPLARLLGALAEGPFASRCALDYVVGAPCVTGAHLVDSLRGCARAVGGEGREVLATAPLPLPGACGLIVPEGTRGVLLEGSDLAGAIWVGCADPAEMGPRGGRGGALVEWALAARLGAGSGAGYAALVNAIADRAAAGPGLAPAAAEELAGLLRLVERLVRGCPMLGARSSSVRVVVGAQQEADLLELASLGVVARWGAAPGGGGRKVLAAALAVVAALAAHHPARALALLSQAPLLRCSAAVAATIDGAAALVSLQTILADECAEGDYPVTEAFISAVAAMAGRGARVPPVPAYVGYTLAALARHASWRYRSAAQRWQLAAASLSVLRKVLEAEGGPRPPGGGENLRAQLLNMLVHQGAGHGALQGALSVDAAGLEAICRQGSNQTFAMEEAVFQALSLIPALLAGAAESAGGGATQLEAALFHQPTMGGAPPATVAASYVGYLYSKQLRHAAVNALAALSKSAGRFHPHPLPIVSCLPRAAGAVTSRARSSLVAPTSASELRKHPEELAACLGLLTVAIHCQPGLADLMLFPCKMDTGSLMAAANHETRAKQVGAAIEAAAGPTAAAGAKGKAWSCLDGLLECVAGNGGGGGGTLAAEAPREMARVLRVLCDLWAQRRGGVAAPAEVLRLQPGLWEALAKVLPDAVPALPPPGGEGGGGGPAAEAHRLACEAMVLRVMSEELCSRPSAVAGAGGEGGLAGLVSGWAGEGGRLLAWVKRYCRPLYRTRALEDAHMLARIVAVRMLIAAEAGGGGVEGVDAGVVAAASAAAAPLLAAGGNPQAAHSSDARVLLLQQLAADMREWAARGEAPPAEAPARRHLLDESNRQCLEWPLLWSAASASSSTREPEYGGDFLYDLAGAAVALGEGRPEGWWATLDEAERGALDALRDAGVMASEADAGLLALRGLRGLLTTAGGLGARGRGGRLLARWGPADARASLAHVTAQLRELRPAVEADRALAAGARWYAQLLARKGAARDGFQSAMAAELAELSVALVRLLCGEGGAVGAAPELSEEEAGLCGGLLDELVGYLALVEVGGGGGGRMEGEEEEEAGPGIVPPLLAGALLMLGRGAAAQGASGRAARARLSAGAAKAVPALCHLAGAGGAVAGAALSCLGVVARSYLEPATWLPIAARHLSIGPLLRPLPLSGAPGPPSGLGEEESALLLALTLARDPGGAHLLFTQGALPQVGAIAEGLLAAAPGEAAAAAGGGSGGGPELYTHAGARGARHGQWLVVLRLLGALMRSLAGTPGAEEQAIALLSELEPRLLRALAPPSGPGAVLTLAWLEEAEATAFLLVQCARFVGRWQLALPGSPRSFRRAAGSFLNFAARIGVAGLGPLACRPVSPAEVAAAGEEGLACTEGWFLHAATAAAAAPPAAPAPASAPAPGGIRMSSFGGASVTVPAPVAAPSPTNFSSRVAEKVYLVCQYLACFLCSASPSGALEEVHKDALGELQEQCGGLAEQLGAGAGAGAGGGARARAAATTAAILEMSVILQDLAGVSNSRALELEAIKRHIASLRGDGGVAGGGSIGDVQLSKPPMAATPAPMRAGGGLGGLGGFPAFGSTVSSPS